LDELLVRVLPDGRGCWLYPISFGKWRLGVGEPGSGGFDDVW
jgi:hypothetical protein